MIERFVENISHLHETSRPSFFGQFFHALHVGGSNIDSIHNANTKYRL